MTLVDTSSLLSLRKKRLWKQVYDKIPTTAVYEGIVELIQSLKDIYSLGIVTSSPSTYARKIINFHELNIPLLIAYHDTSLHKPNPEPIIQGCIQLELPPAKVISIGDDFKDIEASNRAGCTSIFTSWGNTSDTDPSANYNCSTVTHLKQLLTQ